MTLHARQPGEGPGVETTFGTPLSPTVFLPLEPEPRPLDPNDPDVRQLALIELARTRGMPWAAIARALGVKDKRAAKQLHRALKKRVHLRQAIG